MSVTQAHDRKDLIDEGRREQALCTGMLCLDKYVSQETTPGHEPLETSPIQADICVTADFHPRDRGYPYACPRIYVPVSAVTVQIQQPNI